MIRTSKLIAAARYSLVAGFAGLAIVAAAWLSVPPLHHASAQYADLGTYGGVSTGSANAQVITVPNLSANKAGIVIRFVPGAGLTNTGPTQINVSGIGLVNVLRPSSIGLVAFSGGEFQAGEMTCISYNSVASTYQLECNVDMTRIGQTVEVRGSTAPRGTLIEDGSCVSQTTYAALFSVISTTYGTCSGSNFMLPRSNGTAFVAFDAQGANGAANRITTASCATPNAPTLCGTETKTLVTANLPPYTPQGGLSLNVGSLTGVYTGGTPVVEGSGGGIGGGGSFGVAGGTGVSISGAPGGSFTGTAQGGASTPLPVLSPTLPGIRAIKF